MQGFYIIKNKYHKQNSTLFQSHRLMFIQIFILPIYGMHAQIMRRRHIGHNKSVVGANNQDQA